MFFVFKFKCFLTRNFIKYFQFMCFYWQQLIVDIDSNRNRNNRYRLHFANAKACNKLRTSAAVLSVNRKLILLMFI